MGLNNPVNESFSTWLVERTRKNIEKHYERLSERYGPNTAKLIIAAALVGSVSPIPGSTLVAALPIVGLAELVRRVKMGGIRSGLVRREAEKVMGDL